MALVVVVVVGPTAHEAVSALTRICYSVTGFQWPSRCGQRGWEVAFPIDRDSKDLVFSFGSDGVGASEFRVYPLKHLPNYMF